MFEGIPCTEKYDPLPGPHAAAIESMRLASTLRAEEGQKEMATSLMAAAELLQCHDDTGISLDNWEPVRDFVEMWLGYPITPNGA